MISRALFTRALFNAFFLFAIGYFLLTSLDKFAQYYVKTDFFSDWGLLALSLVPAYSIFAVFCFLLMARQFLNKKVKYVHAFEQVGFMLIGKYLPGKLWGIAIRAFLCERYAVKSVDSVSFSLFELIVSVIAGGIVALVLWLASISAIYPLPALLTSAILSYRAYAFHVWLLQRILQMRPFKSLDARSVRLLQTVRFPIYCKCLVTYVIFWLIIGLVLNCYLNIVSNSLEICDRLALSGYYIGGVLVGFLALFAPGGIGVREGLFVLWAADILGYPVATSVAIMMRLWSTVYDIACGVIASALYFCCEEQPATHE